MYEPRPGDIALPPTASIELTHLVRSALEAASFIQEPAAEPERAV